jgi:hypothetical protein
MLILVILSFAYIMLLSSRVGEINPEIQQQINKITITHGFKTASQRAHEEASGKIVI